MFLLDAWDTLCCTRTLEWCEALTVVQVYLGGGHFAHLNECLFAPALLRDVGAVQLHVQIPSLLPALVAEDLRMRGSLASVLGFFSLLELSSDWLAEDVEALGAVPSSGTFVLAARALSALLKLFAPVLWDVLLPFFAARVGRWCLLPSCNSFGPWFLDCLRPFFPCCLRLLWSNNIFKLLPPAAV